ncbi:complex I NDUFA9 subunit family protein [Marinobacter sp. JSM 1782161]|uniref:complex I NDUFA9 subunit family protein n=1 Tax=Marinobacter sp. JSM 1782161 TaxID=2685906 RepID=UPI00140237BE|nr:complex I NDUFA9 subunit family protein [Marinobacter sp. JSM 1782161]
MTAPLIVVFGGTGYLGTHVVLRCLRAGFRVRIVARQPATLPVASGSASYQAADLNDPASLPQALVDADAVVNAVSLYVEKPPTLTFERVHVTGARQLAEACRQRGIPTLVHLSGLNPDPDSPSRYVSARGRGEQAVRAVFPDAIVLRPSALFGNHRGLMSTLEQLTRLPVIPLFGRGQTRLQPVHVEDVAQAVVNTLAEPTCRGRIYELGGARILTYRQLVCLALRHTGRRRPLLPVPFALWFAGATLLSLLPSPPLTRDQLILMRDDNVVAPDTDDLASLGIKARDIETTG